ncbi:MAG: hypothetical protein PHR61_05320 [Candidatus Absconditabacteria bacterium]|nr:hypothetical protein [Candidatus Absconditabacteria bacterium]
MKIGILTSGNDNLALFSFLQRYDHEYHIWYDDKFSFWGDKSVDLVMERVTEGIGALVAEGVDVVVLPPMVELKARNENLFSNVKILPLFENYILENCFAYSLVGKIGFFGDYFDIQEGQKQLTILAKNYNLSENQLQISKFHFPFAYWGKEVRNWKYLLDTCSWSMPLVHHRIKQDLRFFKDAGVDTIIPCNYSCFLAEKAIEKARYTKMRFYKLSVLEKVFANLKCEKSEYSVSVICTDHGDFLKREKKLQWLLSRGKKININYKQA